MKAVGLSSWLFLSLLLAYSLCGCIPPIKVKTIPVAESLEGTRTAPPTTPEPGRSTRQDMERNFQPFRVEIGAPSLFWVHMYESDHRIWMGFPDERAWESLNLVATFDSNQVVNLLRVFPDGRLPEEVAKMSQEGLLPTLDFSVPAKLQAERYPLTADERSLRPDQMPVTIVAGQAKLTISATVPGKWIPPRSARAVTVAIPREQIIDLWIDNGGPDYRLTERTVDAHLRFKPKNELGSSLAIRVTFADALTLARWLTQAAPGNVEIPPRRRAN